ncbi:hypothetical protein SLE2022_034170 [Rubroshorea leprosula]
MVDESVEVPNEDVEEEDESRRGIFEPIWAPVDWIKMLAMEMHWSFVFGVVVVYGISQGLGGALTQVGTEYYMKDVQQAQPSEAQIYSGITMIPWIIKLLWGILTDVLPLFGYRRRPYFILAGLLGVVSMLLISLHEKLHIAFALVALTAGGTGVAIADVTVDACVAENSISHPSLAADMQSLCAVSSSVGNFIGFLISGILVHLIGPKGVFGLMTIPFALIFLVGILLTESHMPNFSYRQVKQMLYDAVKSMWTTLKFPYVWRSGLYMYIAFMLSLNIHEGLFYWYTDSKGGPHFSQETVGYISSIGSLGAFLGAILYQYVLKDHPFRDLLFWAQLLYGLSGMLDLVLVLRLNLKFGFPDYFFIVIDDGVSQMLNNLKQMPLLVLSAKLCPSGIEGTFFALLMSIENVGYLSSSWGGGFLLHMLKVTRTEFDNLWLAILIRNMLRVSPLCVLFLVPRGNPNSAILPTEMMVSSRDENESLENESIELVSLDNNVDAR